MSDENKEAKLRITVDNKSTEELVKILKEKEEKEKVEKDPESDLAEKKIQAIQKFGRPDLFLQADTKEKLSAILSSYINELVERANPTQKPSGSALVPQQYGAKPEDLYTRKFFDSQEMVSELRRLSHEGTPREKAEAEHYLNEIWKKYVLDKRSNPTRAEPSQNPNTPESLLELGLVQKGENLTPANPEDGDLGKLQRKWREERKRKMTGESE